MASKTCDGNCLSCSFQQQTYCAAQRTYALLKNQETMFSRIDNLEEAIRAMEKAFNRFDTGATIINPFDNTDKAQNGGGAENRPLEQ